MARPKSVDHNSDVVTQKNNTTGVYDSILEVDPTDGTFLKFLNRADIGTAQGLPVFFKLYSDSGGTTELPNDTQIKLQAKTPESDGWKDVSLPENSLASWREKSVKDQRKSDFVDSVKLNLEGEAVNIRDVDKLRVVVNSSKQIDWTSSEFYFYQNSVREGRR